MKFAWLGLILLFLSFTIGFITWYRLSLQPVSIPTVNTFIINQGEPANVIIKNLKSENFIRSYYAARLYHKFKNFVFRPGIYYLSKVASTPEIFAEISKGPKDIKVTFPEGWRREQYAARLKSTFPDFDASAFLNLTATLEGQLFPDTYYLPASPTAQKVVSLLTGNFAKKSSLTPNQKEILIAASLVERESNNESDSPIIAGIIFKRLKNGWPLQIDATVQYAKDTLDCHQKLLTCDYWKPIFDTKFPSSFNTYLKSGLPPAPIANPGLTAINAALNPAETEYWYYLTGNDGKTYFARDLAAHQQLIDTYLKP